MRKYTALLLSVLLTLSLAGCGEDSTEGDTPTYPAAFSGWETLIDEAREEGGLTVCGGESDYLTAACETFEALFDIPVRVQTLSDEALLEKLSAGQHPGDVWFGAEANVLAAAAEAGLLTAVSPDNAAQLSHTSYGDENGFWYGVGLDSVGIMVNPSSLRAMTISAPATWQELTALEYWELVWLPESDSEAGRLMAAAVLEGLGEQEAAVEYFTALEENVYLTCPADDSAAGYIDSGECVIAVGMLHEGAARMVAQGETQLRLILPSDGAACTLTGAAVLTGATHKAAAQLWMEFVLSPSCQELAVKSGAYLWPTVADVTLPEAFPRLHMGEAHYLRDDEAVDALLAAIAEAQTEEE